ncbi:unnamed protein product [Owenia fusiformis]|uniref:Protein Wnt n=1 Tax=Owenia fusiformis TaxID=6347 RepID=A0A8S4NN44_OWEFU|nr:unnamed protein product [Owenia fusiformis]
MIETKGSACSIRQYTKSPNSLKKIPRALASSKKHWNITVHCTKGRRDGLHSSQVDVCKEHIDVMPIVKTAAYVAKQTCQYMFQDRRWNCSSIESVPKMTRDLSLGTREQAFVYAVSSSSLAHTVSRACALGHTLRCGCGLLPTEAPTEEFKWGGCSDDLRYGISFTKTFADAPFLKRNKKSSMNRHNNMVGVQVIDSSLGTACKCHGVSGSCALKTCWKALPDMEKIGHKLKHKYAYAVEVESRRVGRTKRLVPVDHDKIDIGNDELIYYTTSPDYCGPDPKTGSVGTAGRRCIKGDGGSGGCDSMCCGRGFITLNLLKKERCECKYYWCCYVKCKTCRRYVEIHKCR